MSTKVFVYGTLRPGQGAFRTFGLDKMAVNHGPDVIRGSMVSMGGFPGVTVGGEGFVKGDVLEISDPAVLSRLDNYEGVDKYNSEHGLYRKETVQTLKGEEVLVYVINDPKFGRPVPSGDWLVR